MLKNISKIKMFNFFSMGEVLEKYFVHVLEFDVLML